VGLFLNNGADLRILDKTGRSALIHAIENNNPGLVSLLLTFSAEKKYQYSSPTTKRVFDACEVARLTSKRLQNQYERESNKYIRNSLLDCGVVIWPF
jgi:ankyrin repeat protein